jgi:hypothetical protein
MNILYKNPGDFHDITTGTSQGSPSYSAGLGYDFVTGLGTPIANLVVGSLRGTSSTTSNDTLALAAATAEQAGTSFSLTVTARNSSGATDAGFRGTINFTSSDVQAGLPGNYTFTSADQGTHTFTVTLKTAGTASITATDTGTAAITGSLTGITVSPAAASRFVLTGLSSTANAGVAQTVTVTAFDPYGKVATGYSGTVQFSSSDTAASLPANYGFSTANQGVHSFSLTFNTAGTQSVTVTDTASSITVTQSGISVAPAAPMNLAASAVSSTQINLTWTASNGATGYLIQQSATLSSGWTQVGITSGGTTTTFQQTGLSQGTTYYFRVIATVGSMDSASSNVASATTSGTGTGSTADCIWSKSYVPSENAYSYGPYEVGVKFTSSGSGRVAGVRFYQASFMAGYAHVGHLWSSTGVLLASTTFSNSSTPGWQQVNFSSPVAIQANTVYVASFSTGGGYFGISTNFFTRGGVTNGPLQALPSGVAGGDGVYNCAGAFPSVKGNGMNFWADVAFTPSSSSGSTAITSSSTNSRPIAPTNFGYSALTTNQTGRLITSVSVLAPAGPAGYVAGSRGTAPIVFGSLTSRQLAQPATPTKTVKTSWDLEA